MRKLWSLCIFCLLAICGFTQGTYPSVVFSGRVTDAITGLPVANHPIYIYASYGTANWYYGNTLYTDANGIYTDTTTPDTSDAFFYIYLYDCNNFYPSDSIVYQNGVANSVRDFSICVGSPTIFPDFTYQQTPNSFTVDFINQSVGTNTLQYDWDFGNGTNGNGSSPSITYTNPGTYQITLTAYDANSSVTIYKTISVEGTVGACQAGFTFETDVLGGVVLTNTSTNFNNTFGLLNFEPTNNGGGQLGWYLGATYGLTLTDSGAYRTCLSLQDTTGCTSVFCDTITTNGIPSPDDCVAQIGHTQQGPLVYFNGQTYMNIYEVLWDFGDGSPLYYSIDLQPFHIYNTLGTFYASALITNLTSGCQFTLYDTVIITNSSGGNVQAGFTYNVGSNGMVYFEDNSTPVGSLNYFWSFGNGLTSTYLSPATSYADTGWYYVCVAVTDIYTNAQGSFCDSIYIGSIVQDTCNANFTYITNPDSSVTFTSLAYGENLSSLWTITNAFNSVTYYGNNPTVSLPAGSYSVQLSVYGNNCNAQTNQNVTIGGQYSPCSASFTYVVQPSGLVQFTNTSSTNGGIILPGLSFESWDFGNGFTSNNPNPNMFYDSVGVYPVTLYVFDLMSNCQSAITQYVNIPTVGSNNGNCQANFTAIEDTATGIIAFTALATPATGIDYFWNFGDGTYSSIQDNQHAYGSAGQYNVCLTILDPTMGCNADYCQIITTQGYVHYNNCSANYSYFADTDGTIYFYAPISTTPIGVVNYVWDFGNGATDYTANPTYNFGDSLPHYVCLTLLDLTTGCNVSECDSVYPFSGYNARFMYQATNQTVAFTNESTAPTTIEYKWEFGNGQISNQKDPIATYNNVGWQNVCLSIWQNGMMKSMYCDSVYIEATETNVTESKSENIISLAYPNPADTELYADISNQAGQIIEWQLKDLLGKTVKKGDEMAKSNQHTLKIPVQELSQGYYLLSVKIGNSYQMTKIIVE